MPAKGFRLSPFGGGGGASNGTVTDVSVVTANGISGTVANSTTTPAITLDITALDATKIADGTVTNTEFQYLNGVTSGIQAQLDGKQAAGTYVTDVTGTANRITSSGGTTPQIDIAATYVGQASIVTLGTITTGVWNGTAIANANLANSTITIGTTSIALGASSTTIAGMSSITGEAAGLSLRAATGAGQFLRLQGFDGTSYDTVLQVSSVASGTAVIQLFNAIVQLVNSGFSLQDSDASHLLIVNFTSNLTDDRVLTLVTGDENRTLSLLSGLSVASGGDITLTPQAGTNVTLPTSGTLYGTQSGSITSAQLATSVTDETGSGALVFGTTPTLTAPVFAASSGVLATTLLSGVCEGRLSLTTAVPVTTADVSGATTIYFTPYKGDRVAIYNGTVWKLYSFSEVSLALGTIVAFQGYDVFIYDNAGTLTLETAEWKNASVTMTIASPCVVTWTGHGLVTGNTIVFTTTGALPTGLSVNTKYWVTRIDNNTFNLSTTTANLVAGTFINTSGTQSGTHTGHQPHARQTAIDLQNGVYVKNGATTRRYLGSFYTTATTTTEDSGGVDTTQVGGKRFVWNYYNRVNRFMRVIDTTDNWTYTTDAWRIANGLSAGSNCVEFFVGVIEDAVQAFVSGSINLAGNAVAAKSGIGLNSANVPSGLRNAGFNGGVLSANQPMSASYRGFSALGYNYLAWLERGADSTSNFRGDSVADGRQSGLDANILS